MSDLAERVHAWLEREGSTRAVGLMRLGTGLLLWARFGREMMPMRHMEPDRVLLSMGFYLFSTLMVVGWLTPGAMVGMAVVLGLMVIGYGGSGLVEDWSHHHVTLHMLAVWWLALTPCGRSFSVDRWLEVREAERQGRVPPAERGPLWAVALIALQLCTLYLWSVVDKLDNHFLDGIQLEQLGMMYYWGAQPPEHPLLPWVYRALAWGVVALEVAIPLGLWSRRWRMRMVVLGVVMHAGFYVLLPVQTFTLQMLLLYLAFFDPDEVHVALDRLLGHGAPHATG